MKIVIETLRQVIALRAYLPLSNPRSVWKAVQARRDGLTIIAAFRAAAHGESGAQNDATMALSVIKVRPKPL